MEDNNFFEQYDSLLKTKGIAAAEEYALAALNDANNSGDKKLFVSIANELGGLYRVTGKFKAGRIVYESALNILEELGMEHSIPYATTLINLASVCCEERRYKEAVEFYLKAEQIYNQSDDVKDYQRAALYNNLGAALGSEGQYEKALGYAKKSLAIIERHPKAFTELATTHTTLGTLYLEMNNYAEAEKHLLKAQKIFTQRKGAKPNIHYSQTLNALGELYFAQRELEKAKNIYSEALKMLEETYGKNAPSTKSVANKLNDVQTEILANQNPVDVFRNAFQETTPDSKEEKSVKKSVTGLTGLDLSRSYYEICGKPMLNQNFSEYLRYMAIGLVGEGSECLGFDDEFSQDHDFGPGFCIWLPTVIYDKIGLQLQKDYDELPSEFMGYSRKNVTEGTHRVGVFSIDSFYHQYVGKMPVTNIDWLTIPSAHLLTATNGEVFEDFYGEFSQKRQQLSHYPKDVRLKKLAASLFSLSQAGQYNYSRCVNRKDIGGAYLACSEFVKEVISAVYLLNDSYMPYYKWSFRGMGALTKLSEIKEILEKLITEPNDSLNGELKTKLIEQICQLIVRELTAEKLSAISDDFIVNHSYEVMKRITDEQIRQLPVMVDFGK